MLSALALKSLTHQQSGFAVSPLSLYVCVSMPRDFCFRISPGAEFEEISVREVDFFCEFYCSEDLLILYLFKMVFFSMYR